jgi:hypothetical protein
MKGQFLAQFPLSPRLCYNFNQLSVAGNREKAAMTLTVELTPEQEARLAATAQAKGMDMHEYARFLLTQGVLPTVQSVVPVGTRETADRNHFYFTATPEEFERAFDALAEGNENLPVLPPEAYHRENL